jgi:TRAP-type C4-dicarboxylate transport system substrate-binding protein
VLPYEYQRALRQLAEEAAQEKAQQAVNGNNIKLNDSKVRDIEESVVDGAFEKKRLEKILDKTRQVYEHRCGVNTKSMQDTRIMFKYLVNSFINIWYISLFS